MKKRMVVLTNGNYFARLILDRLVNEQTDKIAGILLVEGDYRAHTGFRTLWEVGKSTTLPYFIYKIYTVAAFELAQRLFPGAMLTVGEQARQKRIPTYRSVAVNASEAYSWVASLEPDLIVSVSCPQRISAKMLSVAKLGGINIHSSLLPSYAGLAPYYWVLSAGERDTGTTVHYMTQRFDEGNILVQRRLAIEPGESAFHLFKRLALLGSDALEEAVSLALEGAGGARQESERHSYCSNPNLDSYQALKRHGHALIRTRELLQTIAEEVRRAG